MAQQQQYFQYTAQPGGSSPGATVYAYPGAQQPQMMVIQPVAASTTTPENRLNSCGRRALVALAAVQLVIGCCCICFQSASTYLESSLKSHAFTSEYRGTGIWCGILFIVTGALGISAGKRNTPTLILTFMFMNILSSITGSIMLAFARSNMESVQECQRKGVYTSSLSLVRRTCRDILYSVWIAMDALMIALAAVDLIIAVASAIYTGRAMCKGCINYQQRRVLVATTVQLPAWQQQQQHQAVENKPYPEQEPFTQYPTTGAVPTVSYGQPSHAQSAQPPYYQQQQQVPPLAVSSQNTCGPFASTSEIAIREAAPSGAGYSSPQAYYPPAAGNRNAVPSASELPPSYDTALKL